MFKNLTLSIETDKKTIELNLHINKMTDTKTSLQTGYVNKSGKTQLVKMISILTRDGIDAPKSITDIDTIVDRSKTKSVFCYQDGTKDKPEFIPIEKETLKNIFPSSREIKVISTIPYNNLKPYMFDGVHNFLEIQGVTKKKIKTVETSEKKMFNIIYHGLKKTNSCFIGRYISFNREKFCAIYADETRGLIMSNLHYTNYYRSATSSLVHILKEGEETFDALISHGISKARLAKVEDTRPIYEIMFENIIRKTRQESIDMYELRDKYEELLHKLIEKSKENPDKRIELDEEDLKDIEPMDEDDFL